MHIIIIFIGKDGISRAVNVCVGTRNAVLAKVIHANVLWMPAYYRQIKDNVAYL